MFSSLVVPRHLVRNKAYYALRFFSDNFPVKNGGTVKSTYHKHSDQKLGNKSSRLRNLTKREYRDELCRKSSEDMQAAFADLERFENENSSMLECGLQTVHGTKNMQLLGAVADALIYRIKLVAAQQKGKASIDGVEAGKMKLSEVKATFSENGIPEAEIGEAIQTLYNLKFKSTIIPFRGDLKKIRLSTTAEDFPSIIDNAPLTKQERDLAPKLCNALICLSNPNQPILTAHGSDHWIQRS